MDDTHEHRGRRSARAISIGATPAAAVSASAAIHAGGATHLVGWALKETSALNTAFVRIRDGKGTDGDVLVPISLAASESTRDLMPEWPVWITTGNLFLEVVSGSVEGVVYVLMDHGNPPGA